MEKSIGYRINTLLEEYDMTQRELAKRIGVTEVTIGRYIKDTRQPKSDILATIAKEFNVPLEYFFNSSPRIDTGKLINTSGKMTKEEIAITNNVKDLSPKGQKLVLDFIDLIKSTDEKDRLGQVIS
ncbi:MAG: hypothetical protein ATN36_06705 [Epulopiscium sp. Nele67-Bin005]|nr:MAG: hypothetical protein ATN36_06705 [Epulopiscium sp. Nele67-Bin005]